MIGLFGMFFSVQIMAEPPKDYADMTLLLGRVMSSEDRYGEFVENEKEISLFTPILTWRSFCVSSGLSYLNTHKEIRSYDYNLTQLIIPIRVMGAYPITKKTTVYAGAQTGFSLLLETFERTETYSAMGVGGIVGADYQFTSHYRAIIEYSNFIVTYKRLDNLNTNLGALRVGVGYSF